MCGIVQCNKEDSKDNKATDDRGGKENKEISKKVTCSYMVSDLAYSTGVGVPILIVDNGVVVIPNVPLLLVGSLV